jgi:hypothetical protein
VKGPKDMTKDDPERALQSLDQESYLHFIEVYATENFRNDRLPAQVVDRMKQLFRCKIDESGIGAFSENDETAIVDQILAENSEHLTLKFTNNVIAAGNDQFYGSTRMATLVSLMEQQVGNRFQVWITCEPSPGLKSRCLSSAGKNPFSLASALTEMPKHRGCKCILKLTVTE